MIEGGGSKTFSKARRFLYQHPEASHQLLEMITQSTINYLGRQIAAGADLIQIFDSWAGILSPDQYAEFSLPYMEKIANSISVVPVTLFAKGAWFALADMNKTSARTIGLDWNITPEQAIKLVPNKTLQGNLDPCILYADKQVIVKETNRMLDRFGNHQEGGKS
jgi:uroporphyrinogen decarboxylase